MNCHYGKQKGYEMEGYLFKIEIGNYTGHGRHYNIMADSLEDAWIKLFELAIPEHIYSQMVHWHVTYLGSVKIITNDSV